MNFDFSTFETLQKKINTMILLKKSSGIVNFSPKNGLICLFLLKTQITVLQICSEQSF